MVPVEGTQITTKRRSATARFKMSCGDRSSHSTLLAALQRAALGIFQRLSLPERSKINWPELDWTERQRQQRRTSIPRPRFVVLRICLLKVTTSTTSRLPKNPMKTTIAKNMGTVEQAES